MAKKSRAHTSQNQNTSLNLMKNWRFQSTYPWYHSKILGQLNRWQRNNKLTIKIRLPINPILHLLLSRTSSECIDHVLKAWIRPTPITSQLCKVSTIPNLKIQKTYTTINLDPIPMKSSETTGSPPLRTLDSPPLRTHPINDRRLLSWCRQPA